MYTVFARFRYPQRILHACNVLNEFYLCVLAGPTFKKKKIEFARKHLVGVPGSLNTFD